MSYRSILQPKLDQLSPRAIPGPKLDEHFSDSGSVSLQKDIFEPLLDNPKNHYHLTDEEVSTVTPSMLITGNPSTMKISPGLLFSTEAIKLNSTQSVLVRALSVDTIQPNSAAKNETDKQEKSQKSPAMRIQNLKPGPLTKILVPFTHTLTEYSTVCVVFT